MHARVCLPILFLALCYRCLSILASLILASLLWMRHNSSMPVGLVCRSVYYLYWQELAKLYSQFLKMLMQQFGEL